MRSAKIAGRRLTSGLVLLLACVTLMSGCRTTRDASFIGTFRMGEKVQLGPLTYQAIESDWRTELGSGGRAPDHRYLFLRVTVVNSGNERVPIPAMRIEGGGKTYSEVTEGAEKVDRWLGLIRNIDSSQIDEGWVIFDAPIAAYKLVLTEPGRIETEQHAHVDIPVQLE